MYVFIIYTYAARKMAVSYDKPSEYEEKIYDVTLFFTSALFPEYIIKYYLNENLYILHLPIFPTRKGDVRGGGGGWWIFAHIFFRFVFNRVKIYIHPPQSY